MGEKYDNNSMF